MVSADLTKERRKTKMYGVGVMRVIAKKFRKWASQLLEEVTDKKRVQHKVRIVSAPCFAIENLNDAW